MKVKVLYSARLVYQKISIDYEAIDEGCLQNPVKKWIPIASGYELCIKIGSVLVSHIYTHLVLVVGINNGWYIKLFLVLQEEVWNLLHLHWYSCCLDAFSFSAPVNPYHLEGGL
jgi:hypothetical protein